MNKTCQDQNPLPMAQPDGPHFTVEAGEGEAGEGEVTAWTEIEAGRYMPRRVRGSFPGRALG